MYKSILSVVSSLAVAGFLFMGAGGNASAQTMSTMHHKGHKATVTGCLQKGDEANEYTIKAPDGKMYALTSTKVKNSEHLGHKVTVHGNITPESAEGKESNENAGGMPAAGEKGGDIDMTVTSLKMISTTCQM